MQVNELDIKNMIAGAPPPEHSTHTQPTDSPATTACRSCSQGSVLFTIHRHAREQDGDASQSTNLCESANDWQLPQSPG